MTPEERDALLVRLDERTARADKALFGNGGGPAEGLVSRVAVLEDARERALEEARNEAAKGGFKGGALAGVAMTALYLVARILGVPIPI